MLKKLRGTSNYVLTSVSTKSEGVRDLHVHVGNFMSRDQKRTLGADFIFVLFPL